VHKINPDIHLMCELHVTVKLYRAACSLSDTDSHFEQDVRYTKVGRKSAPPYKRCPGFSLSLASKCCGRTADKT